MGRVLCWDYTTDHDSYPSCAAWSDGVEPGGAFSRAGGCTIVLVGHTVINRIILLGVLKLGNERFWHLRQDTCAINVIEAQAGEFTLVSLNDTCHLQG